MWLSFAPIPNYTAKYYNVAVSDVDWFSVVYFIVSLLVGFISIGILDVFGLKVSVSMPSSGVCVCVCVKFLQPTHAHSYI